MSEEQAIGINMSEEQAIGINMSEEQAIGRTYDLIRACDFGIAQHGAYDNLFKLDKEALQTILHIIEKQAKEIEDLKEDFNKANNIAIKNMTEYISKQKIKDKIKEITKYGNTRYVEELSYKMKNGNWINKSLAKELLQELLEEE